MYRFILRRAVSLVFVLFGVSVTTFGMVVFTPGDPAEIVLRERTAQNPSEEAIREFRAEHGLGDPLHVQYLDWMADVLRGDLGQSYYHETPVTTMIIQRFGETAELAVAAILVALVISIPAGVISAVHNGELPDHASQLGSLLGVSMPNFWLGYLLIVVFSLYLKLFPVSGAGTVQELVLPALTLGSGIAAIITRLLRSSMLDVLEAEYIRTARSKGLRERIVVYKHAFRNALIPVVTIVGLQFGYLLNGAVIVEIVFQRPGLGKLLIEAIFARDYPIVQGLVLVIAVLFVVSNLLVDVAYRYIDPRIRFDGGTR
jgi:peptide/nickel transport system permease protein